MANGQIGGVGAAVAPSGALIAAQPTMLASHLVWVSIVGAERAIPGPARGYLNPRVSPDGRLIAYSEAGTVWTFDPNRGTVTRASSANQDPYIGFPMWSHDGKRLYYRCAEGIRVQNADGEGSSTLLPNTSENDYPSSMTTDGSTLVFGRVSPETGGDIYATPARGGEVRPILRTPSYEGGAQVSPDGKWLLYVTNESGRMEVAVRPLGGPDRKWAVSSDGGTHALWSRDGRRIFYRSGQQFLAVDFTTAPEVRLSKPTVLFDKRYAFGQNITIPNYSISGDGKEFLIIEEEPGGRHFDLTLNWLQGAGR